MERVLSPKKIRIQLKSCNACASAEVLQSSNVSRVETTGRAKPLVYINKLKTLGGKITIHYYYDNLTGRTRVHIYSNQYTHATKINITLSVLEVSCCLSNVNAVSVPLRMASSGPPVFLVSVFKAMAQHLRFVRAGYGLVPSCFALLPIPDLWRWGFHGPTGTVDTTSGEKVRRGDEFL
ncbi:hypothetical protein YC2023_018380 [Brassica napus]